MSEDPTIIAFYGHLNSESHRPEAKAIAAAALATVRAWSADEFRTHAWGAQEYIAKHEGEPCAVEFCRWLRTVR